MRKKGWAVLLAAVMIVGMMSVPAWSAELDYNIGEASEQFGAGGYSTNGSERRRGFVEDFAHLAAARPGTEYFMPLRAQDFEWDRAYGVSRPTSLPIELAKEFRFDLRLDYIKGGEVFDNIAIVERDNQVGLLIDFADYHHSTESVRFAVEAQLCSQGSPIFGADFRIAGTFSNRNRSVYISNMTIPMGVGRQATGMNDAYGLTFELGAGVTMTGDLLFAEEAYGAAIEKRTAEDKALMERYPQIKRVIHLTTIGLSGRVRIASEQVRYVYDGDLTYLGTTQEALRSSRTYYLTTEKL